MHATANTPATTNFGVRIMKGAPLDWPAIAHIATQFITTEYASVTRDGRPVTWPVTPYPSADGRTIRVSTGLTYPLKAERARADPRVALSFSDPTGSGVVQAPTLLIEGLATVHDADLRATSADYLCASAARFPDAFRKIPRWQLRRMAWYWTRMWIDVTPTRVHWWPSGDGQAEPLTWNAPDTFVAPPSDPAPAGSSSGSWTRSATSWSDRVGGALDRLGLPVITTMGADGWPLPWRAVAADEVAGGFAVVAPRGVEVRPGAACLTMHEHDEDFDGQENLTLAGSVTARDGGWVFLPERALADFGVPRNPLRSLLQLRRAGRLLRPRLAHEASRRGQDVPNFDDLGYVRPARR